ncbi:MAG: YciI family protein [Terriglobia bacterium]
MRFMVLVKANKESEAGVMPDRKILAAMGKFNQELLNAGVMLAADGLQPSSKGVRVKFLDGKQVVTDGPFPETEELIAGYWIWQTKSMQDAIEWLKRAPFGGGVEIELRPIFEMQDFAEVSTPELTAQALRQRTQLEQSAKSGKP